MQNASSFEERKIRIKRSRFSDPNANFERIQSRLDRLIKLLTRSRDVNYEPVQEEISEILNHLYKLDMESKKTAQTPVFWYSRQG